MNQNIRVVQEKHSGATEVILMVIMYDCLIWWRGITRACSVPLTDVDRGLPIWCHEVQLLASELAV